MKNTPLLNERALHRTPTYSGVIHTILHLILQHVHYTETHCDLRACVRACASVVAAIAFRKSAFAHTLLVPSSRASFIMHGPHIDVWRLHGQRRGESRRATPWRSFMAWPRAQSRSSYARVRGDRPRKGRVEEATGESARRGRAVSKPVRNSEREQRERCAGTVSSLSLFLSLARPSRRFQLLRRDSLLARRNFFSRSKASRGNTPSRSNSFSERAKRRVKINYKCFLVAIFMRRRISDVFAMKIATVCVVRGEYHGDRKPSIYRSVYRIRRDSIVCLI